MFAIQDEISRAIVNELRLTLGRGQRRYRRTAGVRTVPSGSGGEAGTARGTRVREEAAKLFEQVIAMDPAFAPAYAGLADVYAVMSWHIARPHRR